jgi:hypothetical protein
MALARPPAAALLVLMASCPVPVLADEIPEIGFIEYLVMWSDSDSEAEWLPFFEFSERVGNETVVEGLTENESISVDSREDDHD